MTPPKTTPKRTNKAKASTPEGAAKTSTVKFGAQKELQEWFQDLPKEAKERVRVELDKFISKNTTQDVESGCIEWKKNPMVRGDGIGSRSKDEGRLTFKPYVWLNNFNAGKPKEEQITVPKTDKDNKGPEVNLATLFATIHELKTHITDKLVCSHRCHNKKCVNLKHLCWEQQEINNHRNFCKVATCGHIPTCLVDGPSIVSKEAGQKTMVYDETQGKFVNAAA